MTKMSLAEGQKQFPNSYILDFRYIRSWAKLERKLEKLSRKRLWRKPYEKVVISNMDWMDNLAKKRVLEETGVGNLGDVAAFGQGYVMATERFMKIIARIEDLGYDIIVTDKPFQILSLPRRVTYHLLPKIDSEIDF